MNDRIVYNDPDTGIMVLISPVEHTIAQAQELVPDGLTSAVVQLENFPTLWRLRNAYTLDEASSTVFIDETKAKAFTQEALDEFTRIAVKEAQVSELMGTLGAANAVVARANAVDIDNMTLEEMNALIDSFADGTFFSDLI
jgi:hypothetical protein